MFERFINCIVSFHIVCLLRYTASGAHPAFILHSSCIHPTFILHSSCIHPFCILVCILCVCPVYIRHSSGTQSFLSSSVNSYLRYYLTADSRTSPVPAISHFFIPFYYFHLQMFERFINCIVSFHIVCRLRYTPSGIHPAPSPFYHLRSNLTFGPILPRILEQVLCLRYSTFLSTFITFIYRCSRDLWIALYRSYCVSFTIQYLCTPIPAFHPSVYPVYVRRAPGTHSVLHLRSILTFGTILPRILEQVLCPRYSISRSSRYYTFSLLFFLS